MAPFRRICHFPVFPPTSPSSGSSLIVLVKLQSVNDQSSPHHIGLMPPALTFSYGLRGFPRMISSAVNQQLHPLMLFTSRSEFDRNLVAAFHRFSTVSPDDPPIEFSAPWRLRLKAATYVGVASPDCAAPSGFLNLLTLYSAIKPSDPIACR